MSPEFMPQAPTFDAETLTDTKVQKIDSYLTKNFESKLMVYKSIADDVYANALKVADAIDDREETNIPYRRNAVYLASLLSTVCIRGKEIS